MSLRPKWIRALAEVANKQPEPLLMTPLIGHFGMQFCFIDRLPRFIFNELLAWGKITVDEE